MADPVFPQRPTNANAEVLSVDWLFEPLWPGIRLIAFIDRGTVSLTDERVDELGVERRECGHHRTSFVVEEPDRVSNSSVRRTKRGSERRRNRSGATNGS